MYYRMIVTLLVVGIAGIQGCATARGFGEDLENLGRVIQGKKINRHELPVTEVVMESPETGASEVFVEPPPPVTAPVPQSRPSGEVQTYPYRGGVVQEQSMPTAGQKRPVGTTAF